MSRKENTLKIAFLKQDVYQDLYVGDKDSSAEELLFSSIMRVGPIGLFTLLKADFYIIKEDQSSKECLVWEEVLDLDPAIQRSLKDRPFKESRFYDTYASFKEPGSNDAHSKYAVDYRSVDWNNYDVVISVNICLPEKYISNFPNTLWCYMIGEANKYTDKVYFGYDCCLNQENRGYVFSHKNIIDFPYTFLGPDCLSNIMERSSGLTKEAKNGIYLEINNTKERPFVIPDHFKILERTGQQLKIHQQLIKKNLQELFSSKYFLKVEGRLIRGNGLYEAISCNTLVLCNPHLLIHTQVVPKECWVFSVEEAIEKINYLEANPEEYNQLMLIQKQLLKHFVVDCPVESLKSEYRKKISKGNVSGHFGKHSFIYRVKNRLKRMF